MLALSTFAVAIFLYWATIGFLQRQTDTTIEVEITGLREQYLARGLHGLSRIIGKRIRLGSDPDALYLFADRRLRPLAGNMPAWPELVSRDDGWYSFSHRRQNTDVAARARVLALPEGLLLLVGRDISDLDRLLDTGFKAFAWSGGLVLALSLLGGVLMSGAVVRRVDTINATTRQIIGGDLTHRVPVRGTQDEFDQLATIINRMLEQIEDLMGGMRHVGDSIAHDLRTPLTRLHQSLAEALEVQDVAAMRVRIQAAIEDADGLLNTFSALLRIARIESGAYSKPRGSLVLGPLIADVIDLYSAVAEQRNITLDQALQSDELIVGDRDLVFQLLVNLLDNAINNTPDGGRIEIAVAAASGTVDLIVADTGHGIPVYEHERITRRFYQLDTGGERSGSGLGLALVRAIVDLHAGTLSFADNHPGLRARVAFPAAPRAILGRGHDARSAT